jgi:hypothetical protein
VHSGIEEEARNGRTRIHTGWKTLWFVVWGAMALLAVVNALAPYWILSGTGGIAAGVLLVGCAALLFTHGSPVLLDRKDAALASVVLVLFGAGVFGQRLHTVDPRVDFRAYYIAGHLATDHAIGSLYNEATFPDGRIALMAAPSGNIVEFRGVSASIPFIYPPFFAVLMRPFAYFSYGVAYELWSALTVLLTFAGVWISLSLGGRRVSAELAVVLVAGVFSYIPFFHELVVGQVGSLLLFLCALGVWLLARDRYWPSAFCFAAATMIKITPILVVPVLAMHRKWKWLAAYCCCMTALLGFSVWQTGWAVHEKFWHSVMPSVACGVTTVGDVSVVAWVQELLLGYVPMDEYQSTLPAFACAASKAVSLVVLGLVMLRLYLYRRKENLVLHVMLVMLLSLALSPITWLHHYTIALLPFLYLWGVEREPGRNWLLLATVLIIGTNVVGYALPLSSGIGARLVLAGVVPCLTIALAYASISRESLVKGRFEGA